MSTKTHKKAAASKKRSKRTVRAAPARGRVSKKKISAAVKATSKKPSKKKARAKAKPGRGRGRPKFAPDLGDVLALAEMHCTNDEIAGFFGVATKTVARHRKENPEFQNTIMRGKALGKMSLRRRQMTAALAGNVPMMIWLGKNLLGQAEKVEHRAVDKDGDDVQTHGVLVVPAAMTPEQWVKQAEGHATG